MESGGVDIREASCIGAARDGSLRRYTFVLVLVSACG